MVVMVVDTSHAKMDLGTVFQHGDMGFFICLDYFWNSRIFLEFLGNYEFLFPRVFRKICRSFLGIYQGFTHGLRVKIGKFGKIANHLRIVLRLNSMKRVDEHRLEKS